MSGIFSEGLVLCAAMVLAACAGFFGWKAWAAFARVRRSRQQVMGMRASSQAQGEISADPLISHMERLARSLAHGQTVTLCPPRLARSGWFAERSQCSGLAATVPEQAFCEMRFRVAALLGVVGCVMGCLFSGELACLLAIAGAFAGWRMPAAAVRRRQDERVRRMESHVPEMLDVMALGMRSGLSFDAALKLYCAHFQTEAASELRRAQRSWESGLERREDALRRFARSYDSPMLSRVIEAWIRSLRFGTSMVEGLAAESAQARAAYKAKREEQIAKAPVKMMVPTGTLILPAMLLLVLGPVLLELMNGGI